MLIPPSLASELCIGVNISFVAALSPKSVFFFLVNPAMVVCSWIQATHFRLVLASPDIRMQVESSVKNIRIKVQMWHCTDLRTWQKNSQPINPFTQSNVKEKRKEEASAKPAQLVCWWDRLKEWWVAAELSRIINTGRKVFIQNHLEKVPIQQEMKRWKYRTLVLKLSHFQP